MVSIFLFAAFAAGVPVKSEIPLKFYPSYAEVYDADAGKSVGLKMLKIRRPGRFWMFVDSPRMIEFTLRREVDAGCKLDRTTPPMQFNFVQVECAGQHRRRWPAPGEAAYFLTKEELKDQGLTKARNHFQSTGCKASIVWWPLVTVGTYWKAIIDEASGFPDHNWNKVSITNPDLIQENKALYIPIFSGWSSMLSKLKAVKDIWKFAYLEYKALYPNLCFVWRAMYYYLGGTDELN